MFSSLVLAPVSAGVSPSDLRPDVIVAPKIGRPRLSRGPASLRYGGRNSWKLQLEFTLREIAPSKH